MSNSLKEEIRKGTKIIEIRLFDALIDTYFITFKYKDKKFITRSAERFMGIEGLQSLFDNAVDAFAMHFVHGEGKE